MPSRIVTSTYRYKRPPRKRKAVPLEGPAIVRQEAASVDRRRSPAADRVRRHGSTLAMAERRVAEAELQIVRQKTILDAMARGNHSHRAD